MYLSFVSYVHFYLTDGERRIMGNAIVSFLGDLASRYIIFF